MSGSNKETIPAVLVDKTDRPPDSNGVSDRPQQNTSNSDIVCINSTTDEDVSGNVVGPTSNITTQHQQTTSTISQPLQPAISNTSSI